MLWVQPSFFKQWNIWCPRARWEVCSGPAVKRGGNIGLLPSHFLILSLPAAPKSSEVPSHCLSAKTSPKLVQKKNARWGQMKSCLKNGAGKLQNRKKKKCRCNKKDEFVVRFLFLFGCLFVFSYSHLFLPIYSYFLLVLTTTVFR